jgi:hypothetical protein
MRLTGQISAAACSEAQLARVLDEFKAKGWAPKGAPAREVARASKPRPADHPVAKKARAMWISLHQLGAVRESSEAALEAFARRQLRVEKLQWADQSQGFRLIEALKAMAEREGWSQDLSFVDAEHQLHVLKGNLIRALQKKLGLEPMPRAEIFSLTPAEIDKVITAYARQLADQERR